MYGKISMQSTHSSAIMGLMSLLDFMFSERSDRGTVLKFMS